MSEHEFLAAQFEEQRGHLRAVAYRMLGSASEADDAVQETWLRLSRSDSKAIENLGGWLTTVVARVCLDVLRSRASRREETLDEPSAPPTPTQHTRDPEQEAVLADSVGTALLIVLNRLTPAERIAFVLHDSFGVSFEEIGSIIGRSPAAARQLASRARRRVQGTDTTLSADVRQQREVVNRFLTALRAGDYEGLIAVLDPDVVVHADATAVRTGAAREVRGATTWAKGAVAFSRLAQFVQPMLVNGSVGLVFAPGGRLSRALTFTIGHGKIVSAEIIADPARLQELEVSVLEENGPAAL
ncbi:MAG TPA: sigma-70 family RNA polymerase sigma factor [Terriglobales bacterium]|nr:sigma-70 family RNA polymerase sigma factor [Terriglobales bacterium]